jgi:hypothetical protein
MEINMDPLSSQSRRSYSVLLSAGSEQLGWFVVNSKKAFKMDQLFKLVRLAAETECGRVTR